MVAIGTISICRWCKKSIKLRQGNFWTTKPFDCQSYVCYKALDHPYVHEPRPDEEVAGDLIDLLVTLDTPEDQAEPGLHQ